MRTNKVKRGYRVLCTVLSYENESSVRSVLSDVLKFLTYEINELLVIDNNSQDKSHDNATYFLKNYSQIPTTILKNKKNYGYGGSYKIALDHAYKNNFDYLLIIDGDGSINIEEVKYIFGEPDFPYFDAVFHDRFTSGLKNFGFLRLIGNKLVSLFASIIFKTNIKDFHTGGFTFLKTKSFQDKGFNALRKMPNDVRIGQFLQYFCYTKTLFFCFCGASHDEKDNKSLYRMISQLKGTLVTILKFAFTKPAFFNNLKTVYPITYEFSVEEFHKIKKETEELEGISVVKKTARPMNENIQVGNPQQNVEESESLLEIKKINFHDYSPSLSEIELVNNRINKSVNIVWHDFEDTSLIMPQEIIIQTLLKMCPGESVTTFLPLKKDSNVSFLKRIMSFVNTFGLKVNILISDGKVIDKLNAAHGSVSEVSILIKTGSSRSFLEKITSFNNEIKLRLFVEYDSNNFYRNMMFVEHMKNLERAVEFKIVGASDSFQPDHANFIKEQGVDVLDQLNDFYSDVYHPEDNANIKFKEKDINTSNVPEEINRLINQKYKQLVKNVMD